MIKNFRIYGQDFGDSLLNYRLKELLDREPRNTLNARKWGEGKGLPLRDEGKEGRMGF